MKNKEFNLSFFKKGIPLREIIRKSYTSSSGIKKPTIYGEKQIWGIDVFNNPYGEFHPVKFDKILFMGNGICSMYEKRNLKKQIDLLISLMSGMQQGGKDLYPEFTRTLKENIKTALDL